MKPLMRSVALFAAMLAGAQSASAGADEVIQLLGSLRCSQCDLRRADLVHASLTSADLEGSDLTGANLSGANLDGANLRNTNLSFTSLHGASLKGADLGGATLHGTDLRRADLTGAQLSASELQQAHWRSATGIPTSVLNYSDLHNAGVELAKSKNWKEAEIWFNKAIQRNPDAAISWLGRGLCRLETGELVNASQDIAYASRLYKQLGDDKLSSDLHQLSQNLITTPKQQKGGNGAGITTINGALGVIRMIAPLAMKALVPMGL